MATGRELVEHMSSSPELLAETRDKFIKAGLVRDEDDFQDFIVELLNGDYDEPTDGQPFKHIDI